MYAPDPNRTPPGLKVLRRYNSNRAGQTMEFGQGDCDDQSVLVASLLESIGHPTRFIAIGFGPANYQHVFAETKVGNKWLPVETTEDWPLGFIPEHIQHRIQRKKTVYN